MTMVWGSGKMNTPKNIIRNEDVLASIFQDDGCGLLLYLIVANKSERCKDDAKCFLVILIMDDMLR